MVQFGVNIINRTKVPESRISSNKKRMSPCIERIESENLIRACWEENKFSFNLCNKIYKGDVCREAFEAMEDAGFLKAEDLYSFFVIAYCSKSSAGIENELYHYNFGIGVTGGNQISLDKFKALLDEKSVYEALNRFLGQRNLSDQYTEILRKIYRGFLNECVSKWENNLRSEYLSDGFQVLVSAWGFEDVLCMLAEKEWFHRDVIAKKMLSVKFFDHIARPNKTPVTVAAYYRCINNGGAQRVVASLCNIWSQMKDAQGNYLYKVILITDNGPNKEDYPLLDNIKREYFRTRIYSLKRNTENVLKPGIES
jgi:hypothetical protein